MKSFPEKIREHFLAPRNVGELEEATGRAEARNDACGDRLVVTARVAGGRVDGIAFRASACSAVIAVASLATEAARGLAPEAARRLDVGELVRAAGGLPPGKGHAVELVGRALRDALRDA